MPEGSNKPFVVTDRRRFTSEGEVRPDAPPPSDDRHSEAPVASTTPSSVAAPAAAGNSSSGPQAVPREASSQTFSAPPPPLEEAGLDDPSSFSDYPAPTAEQAEQSRLAYQATADRLDTAVRATNPGMDHPPAANFEQLVQSLYMTAIVQLGGAAGEGQKPQIDLLGARQSIDMLGVLGDKTRGNLSASEVKFFDSALFEVRMAFLEITQGARALSFV